MMMYKSLVSTGQKDLATGPLVDSIRRVGCFGICLAPLDLRQVGAALLPCCCRVPVAHGCLSTRQFGHRAKLGPVCGRCCRVDRAVVVCGVIAVKLVALPSSLTALSSVCDAIMIDISSQESTRHTEAMDAITRYLGVGSYAQWDEETRQSWLLTELQGKRPLLPRNVPLSNLGFDEIVQVWCSVVVSVGSRQAGR